MFRSNLILTTTCASALLATSTTATVIQIDVGRANNETAVAGWNNFNNGNNSGSAGGSAVIDLVDSTGTGTLIDVALASGGSWAGAGADFTAAVPAPFTAAPSAATDDSLFIRGSTIDIVFSDLTIGYTYDFVIWGGRGGTQGGIDGSDVTFTAIGGNGPFVGSYETSLGNQIVITFTGVTADTNGEITVSYGTNNTSTGGPTSTNSEAGALNVIQITENVPEPGSLALLGLGGLMMSRRRR